jgi:hypothetical protein
MKKTNVKQANRVYTQQLDEFPGHNWAVFTREPSRNSAYFRCLLASKEEATEIARNFAAEAVARGWVDFTYYVVQIQHRVGIEKSKPVDQPI